MAKYKPCNDQQLIMLTISLQDQLVPVSLEHTISEVVDKHIDLSVFDARYRNDETGAGKIYAQRLRIVEPVFANICFHKHMNRFTLRTKPKVDAQWRLYAMVHNIGKIHAFGRRN